MAIIFTTAYDHYAVKAFKFSAIDYLLKPIDIEELKSAVRKAQAIGSQNLSAQKLQALLESRHKAAARRPILMVANSDAIDFIKIRDIVRIEAQGAYTKFYMNDDRTFVASKVMKEFEFRLKDHTFCRVHQSHLINLDYITKYMRAQHSILMSDGSLISLSRSRKHQFFAMLEEWH